MSLPTRDPFSKLASPHWLYMSQACDASKSPTDFQDFLGGLDSPEFGSVSPPAKLAQAKV